MTSIGIGTLDLYILSMYYIVRHLSIFYRPPSVCVIYSSATYVSTRGFSTEEGQAFYLDFIPILFDTTSNSKDSIAQIDLTFHVSFILVVMMWWLWWWWRRWRLFRNRCRCQKELFELFYPSKGIFHQAEETPNKKIKRAHNELVEVFSERVDAQVVRSLPVWLLAPWDWSF